jgi:hypothetical protein
MPVSMLQLDARKLLQYMLLANLAPAVQLLLLLTSPDS